MERSRAGTTLVELLTQSRTRAYRSTTVPDLEDPASRRELYLGRRCTCSTRLTDLDAPAGEGESIPVDESDRTGWAARATHSGVRGGRCGIFYGTGSLSNGDPATAAGVVTCENP